MSDLIERMARAMCKQGPYDPDAIAPNDGPHWKYYAPGADAARAVIRPGDYLGNGLVAVPKKPTEAMIDAGVDPFFCCSDPRNAARSMFKAMLAVFQRDAANGEDG